MSDTTPPAYEAGKSYSAEDISELVGQVFALLLPKIEIVRGGRPAVMKIMRAELKAAFPETKFSVRANGIPYIDISWAENGGNSRGGRDVTVQMLCEPVARH
jgi:hypothetical protein